VGPVACFLATCIWNGLRLAPCRVAPSVFCQNPLSCVSELDIYFLTILPKMPRLGLGWLSNAICLLSLPLRVQRLSCFNLTFARAGISLRLKGEDFVFIVCSPGRPRRFFPGPGLISAGV